MSSSDGAGIGGYGDIHENLRFWIGRLVSLSGPDPLVLYDIGANDGELTLPFCRAPRRLFAFEPLPAARGRLMQRAVETGADKALTVLPCALGETAGQAVMDVFTDDTFSTLHGRPQDDLDQYGLRLVDRSEVPVLALDSLTDTGSAGESPPAVLSAVLSTVIEASVPAGLTVPLPPPDIVKIDVEGAERSVLRGAGETLGRHLPSILIEYSCINTKNAGYAREEILETIRSLGYEEVYGLYRNRDRSLFTGAALESCRIWNVLAFSPRHRSALEGVEIRDAVPPE